MTKMPDDADTMGLRSWLARVLDWEEAHASFDTAVADLPGKLRGSRPDGLPYSPWQLVEHMRLTQNDVLEFCRPATYVERQWPADYWPKEAAPPSAGAWEESLAGFRKDRAALISMARDPSIDLLAAVPNGRGEQTYARELLLVADHTAYHVGELVVVRRLLGAWKG